MDKKTADDIRSDSILKLRIARYVSDSALIAHYAGGISRAAHIETALEYADEVTEAAARLRAEIARIESERDDND